VVVCFLVVVVVAVVVVVVVDVAVAVGSACMFVSIPSTRLRALSTRSHAATSSNSR
jgi:DNA-binding cell septation regulator SpoVG